MNNLLCLETREENTELSQYFPRWVEMITVRAEIWDLRSIVTTDQDQRDVRSGDQCIDVNPEQGPGDAGIGTQIDTE